MQITIIKTKTADFVKNLHLCNSQTFWSQLYTLADKCKIIIFKLKDMVVVECLVAECTTKSTYKCLKI